MHINYDSLSKKFLFSNRYPCIWRNVYTFCYFYWNQMNSFGLKNMNGYFFKLFRQNLFYITAYVFKKNFFLALFYLKISPKVTLWTSTTFFKIIFCFIIPRPKKGFSSCKFTATTDLSCYGNETLIRKINFINKCIKNQ